MESHKQCSEIYAETQKKVSGLLSQVMSFLHSLVTAETKGVVKPAVHCFSDILFSFSQFRKESFGQTRSAFVRQLLLLDLLPLLLSELIFYLQMVTDIKFLEGLKINEEALQQVRHSVWEPYTLR